MKKIIFIQLWMCTTFLAQSWQVIGEMPYPVAGGAAVVHDSRIFILGGYSDFSQNPVDFIQVYDPLTDEWELVNHMNEARYGLSAGVIDNKIFYFGGIRDSSDYLNSLESYMAVPEDTVTVPIQNDSFNRTFASSVVDGNSLYIFGGEPYFEADSIELPYLSIFDLSLFDSGEEYDTLFSPKEPAHHQMAAKVGDEIFIFGGVSNSIENKIYIFNIPERKFTRAAINMLLPRASGTAVYLPDRKKIYLIGGLDEVEPALRDVEVYSLESETSSVNEIGPLNIARSEPLAVAFDNKIYVMGGKDELGKVVSTIEVYPAAVTAIEDAALLSDFRLEQNYPNPFNPETNISFNLPEAANVKITIYNSLGEQVVKLIDDFISAGGHSVKWRGENSSGDIVPSGVYFYRLETQNSTSIKKMTLLK